MQSIRDLTINMDVSYVRRNKRQLALFFDAFSKQYKKGLVDPLLAYKISREQFDSLGTLWVNSNSIDSRSLRIIQTIEDSYLSTSFFIFKDGKIGSRGYVYYCSAIKDNNDRKYLRLLNFADISVQLLESTYERYGSRWEFGIYALLDDIRYKLLILDECFEGALLDSKIIGKSVTMFYDYLQGNIPTLSDVREFTANLKELFIKLAQSRPTQDIRKYKEAEHPFQNLIFRDTLIASLNGTAIGSIIGIRYGGSELPFLIGKYIPEAKIYRIRVSNYSSVEYDGLSSISEINPEDSVLILDDNILTGRTLEKLINYLKNRTVKRIYFGCVTYSGMKRYPQMIMEGHGVVNTDVLKWSCVVDESSYTKITSSHSYENSRGVFDKTREQLQRRMRNDNMEFEL